MADYGPKMLPTLNIVMLSHRVRNGGGRESRWEQHVSSRQMSPNPSFPHTHILPCPPS